MYHFDSGRAAARSSSLRAARSGCCCCRRMQKGHVKCCMNPRVCVAAPWRVLTTAHRAVPTRPGRLALVCSAFVRPPGDMRKPFRRLGAEPATCAARSGWAWPRVHRTLKWACAVAVAGRRATPLRPSQSSRLAAAAAANQLDAASICHLETIMIGLLCGCWPAAARGSVARVLAPPARVSFNGVACFHYHRLASGVHLYARGSSLARRRLLSRGGGARTMGAARARMDWRQSGRNKHQQLEGAADGLVCVCVRSTIMQMSGPGQCQSGVVNGNGRAGWRLERARISRAAVRSRTLWFSSRKISRLTSLI
jgi:hypothetical protein